jgi:hypothetical protein
MGDKVGKGFLNQNPAQATDKHPTHKGYITLDKDVKAGTKLWLSGWRGQNDKGPYISLNAEVSQQTAPKDAEPPRQATQGKRVDLMDDEIPFAPEFR